VFANPFKKEHFYTPPKCIFDKKLFSKISKFALFYPNFFKIFPFLKKNYTIYSIFFLFHSDKNLSKQKLFQNKTITQPNKLYSPILPFVLNPTKKFKHSTHHKKIYQLPLIPFNNFNPKKSLTIQICFFILFLAKQKTVNKPSNP
jgi:hypothetical protein